MAVTWLLLLVLLIRKARPLGLRLILRGACLGITAVEDLQPPTVHLDDRQVHGLIDGRADLLHQREGQIRLDLTIPLGHALLTDPLGGALDLLLRDRQAGHLRKGLASLAE